MYFLNMERENEHKMSNGVIEYLAMLVGFFAGVDKGLWVVIWWTFCELMAEELSF